MHQLLQLLKLSSEFLSKRGIDNARRQAEEIFCDALTLDRIQLYTQYDRPVSDDEVALLRQHEVRALFIQASGGELTYAKLEAARALGLPVMMLTRPQAPEGASGSVPEAMAWLVAVLGRSTCV